MVRAVGCINRFANIFVGAGTAFASRHTNYTIFYFYGRAIWVRCACTADAASVEEVKKVDAKMPLKIVPSCDMSKMPLTTCFIVDVTCMMINKKVQIEQVFCFRNEMQTFLRLFTTRWSGRQNDVWPSHKLNKNINWNGIGEGRQPACRSHCSSWYITPTLAKNFPSVYTYHRTASTHTHIRDH